MGDVSFVSVWNVTPHRCIISRHYNFDYLNRREFVKEVMDCLPHVLEALEPYVGKCGQIEVIGDLEFQVMDYTETDFKLADEEFCEWIGAQVERMEARRYGAN